MFEVKADSVESYLSFDPSREADLRRTDGIVRGAAPELARWFKTADPSGSPGMRMTMIGYGAFRYRLPSTELEGLWPIVGLALQKNYLSLYCSARVDSSPFTAAYTDRLGRARISSTGAVTFADLDHVDLDGLSAMITDLQDGLRNDAVELRYGKSGTCIRQVEPPRG